MLPDLLDSYQLKAKQACRDKDLVVIHGGQESGKSHFLHHLLTEQILSGRFVLFITSDPHRVRAAMGFLRLYRLGQRALVYEPGSPVPGDISDRLALVLKQKATEPADPEHEFRLVAYQDGLQKARSFYQKLNRKSLFDKSWHELLAIQAFDRNNAQVLHYNHLIQPAGFRFHQEEYDKLLDAVVQASELVRSDLAATDREFKSAVYQAENDQQAWSGVESWIVESRRSTNRVLSNINHFLDDYASSRMDRYLDELAGFRKQLEEIRFEANRLLIMKERDALPSSGRSIFGNRGSTEKAWKGRLLELSVRLKQLIEKTAQREIHGFLADEESEWMASTDPRLFLKKIDELLHQLENARPFVVRFVRQKLDALNTNQSEHPGLELLEQEVRQLYDGINKASPVNTTYEHTAFSINKILRQLEDLLDDLNRYASLEPGFRHFFEWNRFYYSQTEQIRRLLDKLSVIRPADWIAFFRNWYVQNVLFINRSLFEQEVDDTLAKLADEGKHLPIALTSRFEQADNKMNRKLLDRKDDMDYSALRKALGSKSGPALTWQDLFNGYTEFMQRQFPVLFVREDQLDLLPDKAWELLVWNRDQVGKEELILLDKYRKKAKRIVLSIAKETPEEEVLGGIFEKGIEPVHFRGYHQQAIIPMDEMNHTERLYAARNLAFLLEDLNPRLTVFHLKDHILFSCLSETLNAVLVQLLDNRGIKRTRVLESPHHLIVENLLEYRTDRILITQDALVNNRKYERIEWQLFVLERVRKAGLRTVDFKTNRLLKNPVQEMIRFVDQHFPIKQDESTDSDPSPEE